MKEIEKETDSIMSEVAKRLEKEKPPVVNRESVTLVNGEPVTDDHLTLKENGQQKDYVVLSDGERAKGFVRPVRRSYIHVGKDSQNGITASGCGTLTTMSMPIAETYARDPKFYGGTFCVGCGTHLPLTEFVWAGTAEQVGS